MIKTIWCGFFLLSCAGMANAARADEPNGGMFPDVPKGHWAYAAVADLKARGILTGYPAEIPAKKAVSAKKAKGKAKSAAKLHGGQPKQANR